MESEDWARTIAIGGALFFLSFLLVPLFVAYGYLVRTMRRSLTQDPNHQCSMTGVSYS